LKCFEPDLKLLGHVEQHDPTLVTPFESVLDLTWLPDPTKLGPAAKLALIVFRKGSNTLSCNFCQKNTAKECPPPGLKLGTRICPQCPKAWQTPRQVFVAWGRGQARVVAPTLWLVSSCARCRQLELINYN